jgi:hypothetical protein
MNRAQAVEFCAALQRLMKRYKLDSIEPVDAETIALFDEYGRRTASFKSIDITDGPKDLTSRER